MGKAKKAAGPEAVAYGLRPEFEPLNGARVTLPGGAEFNIKTALTRGKGQIVTDDVEMQRVFDGREELERVKVKASTPKTKKPKARTAPAAATSAPEGTPPAETVGAGTANDEQGGES